MRVICFFDLPTLTTQDRVQYRKFRKYLIKSGFVQEQESVYSKLVPNSTSALSIEENIRKNRPETGLVELLKITEKQYEGIVLITGEKNINVITSDERLIVL